MLCLNFDKSANTVNNKKSNKKRKEKEGIGN